MSMETLGSSLQEISDHFGRKWSLSSSSSQGWCRCAGLGTGYLPCAHQHQAASVSTRRAAQTSGFNELGL